MEEIIKILKQAHRGEGAFNRDRHIHADNCIDNMKSLILKAIEKLEALKSK